MSVINDQVLIYAKENHLLSRLPLAVRLFQDQSISITDTIIKDRTDGERIVLS